MLEIRYVSSSTEPTGSDAYNLVCSIVQWSFTKFAQMKP